MDERETRAWAGLAEMQGRLGTELNRRLAAQSGLSAQDYAVAIVLAAAPEGAVRPFELAERLGWEKSRLSHHINRMQGRGLVEKEPCVEDRRGWLVAITPKGRADIEAATPPHLADVRELFFDLFTEDQLDALGDIVGTVMANLDRLDDERAGLNEQRGSETESVAAMAS